MTVIEITKEWETVFVKKNNRFPSQKERLQFFNNEVIKLQQELVNRVELVNNPHLKLKVV